MTWKALGSHFINNSWIEGSGSDFFSINPATSQIVFKARSATQEEVNQAIEAARLGFPKWALTPIEKRIEAIERFAKELEHHLTTLKEAISQETGKPLWESLQEIQSVISKVEISIRAYWERTGERSIPYSGASLMVRHKPHGVAAIFGPFNFPAHLPQGHIIPALLAGNTIVFKASERTPLVAKLITECWEKAELPPGVFNLLQGGQASGVFLATHPGIDALFFTGSYSTGRWLAEQFAAHPQKILALELGGNNPLVIWKPIQAQAAAYQTILSSFLTAGQRCTCARRLILSNHDPLSDHFLQYLLKFIDTLRIGSYTDTPEPFMGPVISNQAALSLLETQEQLVAAGGMPLKRMQLKQEDGALLTPGLIDMTGTKKEDREIFGPLLQLTYVSSFEEAIQEANATSYGLSASIFSESPELYHQFLTQVRAGIINWNMPTTGASSSAPFGGIGNSGNHRPSAYYAADYCAYPVASLEASEPRLPPNSFFL